MKAIQLGFRGLLDCFLLYPVALADSLTNTGFESGLPPWTYVGSAGYQGDITAGTLTLAPFSGSYQGYAMAGVGAAALTPLYAESGIDLTTFANLADISVLLPPEEAAQIWGSALGQTFTAYPGDTISFRYSFATNSDDVVRGDSAGFIMITGAEGSLIDFQLWGDDIFSGLGWHTTGYDPYTYEFSTGGEYRLTVGAVDEGNTQATSYMLVDNVEVTPIPEPSTLALLGLGLGAVALACRRRMN